MPPNLVIGIEADFAGANNAKSIAGIPGAENPTVAGSPGGDTASFKQTWDAGLRARLGYLITPVMLAFVSAGGAWTHVSATAFCGASAFPTGWCVAADANTTSTATATMSGWSAGGGLEYVFAERWLLRGEYRYSDYGHFNRTFFAGLPTATPNGDAIAASVRLRTSTALLGLAYNFGGP